MSLINSYLCFVCLQNNNMSLPVVYLEPMLDQELARRLATIITKHQVNRYSGKDDHKDR